MDTGKATPELFAALASAQAEVENATKGSVNPHFKSRYADLSEVLNTVRPVFARHGVSIIQSTSFDGSMVTVTTVLAHSSGGIVSSEASCVPAKSDAQGIGSATTYLRRYGLSAMAGVAQEDDDGVGAAHDAKPEKKEKPTERQKSGTISAAEQKRQLAAIEEDLLDAHTENDVRRCVDIWAAIAERDGWSADYWKSALVKFKAKRDEIKSKAANDEGFPGAASMDDVARASTLNAG